MTTGNIKFLFDGPEDAAVTVVLAHGAGVPMDAPFMNAFAEGIAKGGFRVARFEFPYMQRQRTEGKRYPPSPAPVLVERYLAVVGALGGGSNLVIGGKSLGGRIATLIANQVGAKGVICLGYPFHPPEKPENTRIEYLKNIAAPTLILQGGEDPFGAPDEVAGYGLPENVKVTWLEGGDHHLVTADDSDADNEQNWAEGAGAIAEFVKSLA
ncbi:MAG: alpha/beta hydrolase [Rhodospirillaceae bacterium]|nr:alpha/beta hydrolase [Rhodospirillaceae bacterium]